MPSTYCADVLLSDERSMASNDTDNRAEKRVFGKIKKNPPASSNAMAGVQATSEGIGSASRP